MHSDLKCTILILCKRDGVIKVLGVGRVNGEGEDIAHVAPA